MNKKTAVVAGLTVAGTLAGAAPASAAWSAVVPDVSWGAKSCKNNSVQVRRDKGAVDVVWGEFIVNCTGRANLRLEFYGPGGLKKIVDGYATAGRTTTQGAFGFYKAGYWSACGSFRNDNTWSLVPGTRVCATDYK